MATTLDDLKHFLNEKEVTYDVHEDDAVIIIGFASGPDEMTYRDADGDPCVKVVVRLAERGEFVAVFAPHAWNLAGCAHRAAVCEAATRVQAHMKLIRFDLDDDDYFQPNVEISLEDAAMCSAQLHRAITGILLAIHQFDPVFRHAMERGEVDMDLAHTAPPEPPIDITGILDLARDAGGFDALERLLGGDDVPPLQA